MLLQLPKELIISVSSYLDLKDKLSLVLTCRWLRDVILECSLYEQLSISGGLPTTREVIRQFKERKLKGSQVKLLKLHLGHLSNQLYRRLPVIFPNVSELVNVKEDNDSNIPNYYFGSFSHQFDEMGNGSHEGRRDDYVLEALLKWKDKIEKYDMKKGFLQMIYLLQNNTFSRLMHLVLTPSISFSQKTIDVKLLDCLKNAPALKTLHIYDCTVNLEFIENLHAASPRLKSLELFKVNIAMQSDVLPRKIEPAMDISTLILDKTTSIADANCILLDYIIAKYKKLCHFELFSGFTPYLQNRGTFFLSAHYQPDQEPTRRAYNIEGARLLLTLPSTLKTLRMDGELFDNIIEALDNSVARPKTLEFYTKRNSHSSKMISNLFVHPKQLEYLQKSISLTSLTAGFNPTLQLHQEIISVSITKLTISIDGMPSNNIGLNWLLSSFPSLNKLVIESSTSMIVGSETDRIPYPHLYKLSISKGISKDNIHPKLFNYVRTVASNITDLDWRISCDLRITNTSRSGYVEPLKTKTIKANTRVIPDPFYPPAQLFTSTQEVFYNSPLPPLTRCYIIPTPPPPPPPPPPQRNIHRRLPELYGTLPDIELLPIHQANSNQESSQLRPIAPRNTQATMPLYLPVNCQSYPTPEQYMPPYMVPPPFESDSDPSPTTPFSGTVQQQQQQQWQKEEENEEEVFDNVFYEMDLSGHKMNTLQIHTDFIMNVNTKALFEIKTLDKTYVYYFYSIAGGGYSITASKFSSDQHARLPKIVIKCDKIKKLMLGQHSIVLDAQMVGLENDQMYFFPNDSFSGWL